MMLGTGYSGVSRIGRWGEFWRQVSCEDSQRGVVRYEFVSDKRVVVGLELVFEDKG